MLTGQHLTSHQEFIYNARPCRASSWSPATTKSTGSTWRRSGEFRLAGHEHRVLFVNDGSSDGTLRVLESLRDTNPPASTSSNLERNSGKAEAVRRGIEAAIERAPDVTGSGTPTSPRRSTELAGFLDDLGARPEIEMVFGARVRLLGREISRHPRVTTSAASAPR